MGTCGPTASGGSRHRWCGAPRSVGHSRRLQPARSPIACGLVERVAADEAWGGPMISSYCLGRVPLNILQSSENRSAKKPVSWSAIPHLLPTVHARCRSAALWPRADMVSDKIDSVCGFTQRSGRLHWPLQIDGPLAPRQKAPLATTPGPTRCAPQQRNLRHRRGSHLSVGELGWSPNELHCAQAAPRHPRIERARRPPQPDRVDRP